MHFCNAELGKSWSWEGCEGRKVSPQKGPVTEANLPGKVTERAPHAFPLQGPGVRSLRPGPAPLSAAAQAFAPQAEHRARAGPDSSAPVGTPRAILGRPLVSQAPPAPGPICATTRIPYPDPPSLIPPLLGRAHLTERPKV